MDTGTAEVATTLVDGVPAYWVDSGRPSLRASLLFRRGIADESLTTRGHTHLLEHLALDEPARGALDVNGSVQLQFTSFDAYGDPQDVSQQLSRVSRWLARPELGRLSHALGVLEAETAQRPKGAVAQALLWRYGAQGPGLVGFDEFGLRRVRPQDLVALSQRAFTSGNAVLALDGPVPASLSLGLTDGERLATPDAVPCDDVLPRRAAYPAAPGALALSGVVRRSAAATSFARILCQRLTSLLRHELGVSYSPWSHYERVGPERAFVTVGADIDDARAAALLDPVFEVVEHLASEGAVIDEVRDDRERAVRAYGDPLHVQTEGWVTALAVLLGETVRSLAELCAEAEQVTPEAVRESAEEFAASLTAAVPEHLQRTKAEVAWLRQPFRDAVHGREFSSLDAPVVRESIVVSESTVAVRTPRGYRGVDVDRLAGVVAFEDGRRVLIDRDAYNVTVEPTLWRDGAGLVALVDRIVSEDLRIPLPARPASEIPRPRTTLWKRWRVRLTTRRWIDVYWIVATLVAGGLGVLMLAFPYPGEGSLGVSVVPIVLVRVAHFLTYRQRRRGR